MNNHISFKSDIRKTLLVFAILPIVILSFLLITKIYFTLEQVDEINHEKILKALDYKLDNFFENIIEKSNFIKEYHYNNKKVKLDIFIKSNKEFNSIIVLNQQGIVTKIASNTPTKIFQGFDYSNKSLFKKFIKDKKSFFSTAHISNISNKYIISYIFQRETNIFIFNININSLRKYIQYLEDNSNLRVIIADQNGHYVLDTNNHNINSRSFFLSTLYKNGIKNKKELEYTEIYNKSMDSNIFIMYIKNHQSNWIITTIAKDMIDQSITYIILWTILFIVLITIFMFINAIKFTEHIVKPIEQLTEKMEKFSSSNNIVTLKVDKEYPIFIRIATSFNKMQKTILEKQNRIKQEIKQNKEKEKILFEQSKMAAMGEMIGNIAHQWRQPLSTISTTASGVLVEKEYDLLTDDKLIKHMDTILESTEFLTQTIDDFRNFFKKDKVKTDINITKIITKTLTLLKGTLDNNGIDIEQNITDITILGYENEMIQALLNILNNAKDALKEQTIDKKIIQISSTIDQNNINIIIHDNAGGIPEDIINRIFEPYFTTKHQSQGTGIGLYMTREIIVNHMKGDIIVSNEQLSYNQKQYYGAKFIIKLPLLDEN